MIGSQDVMDGISGREMRQTLHLEIRPLNPFLIRLPLQAEKVFQQRRKTRNLSSHLLSCAAWLRSSRSILCAAACGAPQRAGARRRRRPRRCAATRGPRVGKPRSGCCPACPPLPTTPRRGLPRVSLRRQARSSLLARRTCGHARSQSSSLLDAKAL